MKSDKLVVNASPVLSLAKTIEIPESAFRALKIPEDQWPAFSRSTVAVAVYREGRISLGKAKEDLDTLWILA